MSIINTHGYEVEVNEHAGEKSVYTDITPRAKQSDMVIALKKMAGDKYLFKCLDSFEWQAAEYIIDLEKENNFLKDLIRKYHLSNDAFTGKGNMHGTTLQNKFTK